MGYKFDWPVERAEFIAASSPEWIAEFGEQAWNAAWACIGESHNPQAAWSHVQALIDKK